MIILSPVPAGLGSFNDPRGYWSRSVNGSLDRCLCEFLQNQTRGGGGAYTFTVIGDGTTETYRSEVSGEGGASAPVGTNNGLKDGDEIWIGFSVMCDPATTLSRDNAEVIFQVHATAGPYGYTNPMLLLSVKRNRIQFEHKYDSNLDPVDASGIRTVSITDMGEVWPGTWTDFVLHIKFAKTTPGVTEVWRDARLRYSNTSAPNSLNYTGVTHYLKHGCYVTGWKSSPAAAGSADATRIWHFDQFRVGDAASSVLEISPSGIAVPAKTQLSIL